jgi:histidine ammonia-lyase
MTAFQAMEFLRPLTSSRPIERLRRAFRRSVRPWDRDRILSTDLEKARQFVDGEAIRLETASLR